jgi:hypothetical protein
MRGLVTKLRRERPHGVVDNARLPPDTERFAEHRGKGYTYDLESGQQYVGHGGPGHKVQAEDAVTKVKGKMRYTTDFPGCPLHPPINT